MVKKNGGKQGKLRIALFFLLGFALVLIAVVAAAALLFDNRAGFVPRQMPPPERFSQDVRRFSLLINDVIKSKSGQIGQVIFSEDEVNDILVLLERSDSIREFITGQVSGKAEQKNYQIEYKNGKLMVNFIVDSGINTPFGRYMTLRIVGVPEITQKTEKFKVESVLAGRLPFYSGYAEKKINAFIADNREKDFYRIPRKIIIAAQPLRDGRLSVSYRPDELKFFLIQQIFK